MHPCDGCGKGASMPSRFVMRAALVAACALSVSGARATVLIFEPSTGAYGETGIPLPQGYGNRVVSSTQNGFKYLLDGGPTPNVVVQHSTGGFAQLYPW